MSFKQRELKEFLKKNKVDLLGCYETKVKQNKASKVQQCFGSGWTYTCNYGSAVNGRIWVMWNAGVDVLILKESSQTMHCKVKDRNSNFSSFVTFVYGLHTLADRLPLWTQLREINTIVSGPWLVVGDFNSVLTVDDRINGAPVHQGELFDFQDCVDDLGLGILNKSGSTYSWSNKRDAGERIYNLIDWALGNAAWFQNFGGIGAYYMLPHCSDHTSILINTTLSRSVGKAPYRLLLALLQQEQFKQAVQLVWARQIRGYTMYAVWRKLKLLELYTRGMHREFSTIETKLLELKGRLREVQEKLNADHFNQILIEEERNINVQVEKWDSIQEKKYFDRNLELHGSISEFRDFFQNLLGESAPRLPGIDITTARDGPCLALSQQQQLIVPVTRQEIIQAVNDLPNDKAPGIDGYPAKFFKQNWEIVGEDIINAVGQFFVSGKLLKEVNCTTVT
ncbi:uncharacterized protein LOC132616812 [Lycium barbarum]|uniref:uncharacterized protein LOC132616812 n=1 Tax=Lycium barbarum TaxID=112863 RepID=UPI00293F6D9D|nr:uncharacterized protein LOC132616812 [Lycium barbarum]